MTEFDFHSLGELCDVKGGKRLPKGEQLTKTKTNHPYIRTRDLHNNQVSLSDLEYVPDAVFPKISRYIVNEGDIILSIVGTIGLIASIPKELDKASLTENCVKLVSIDNDILAKNFLYYYLISKLGQDEIYVRNVGSTQPKLPIYNIKDIPVPLPPLREQKAISEVLSSLDNKIELLQKQNETLEALAQTLFRQWFIEEADDSWEEVELVDCCDYVSSGGTPKTSVSEYYDGDVNWFSTKELKDGYLYESEKNISINGLENSSAKLFPENSVLIAIYAAPTVGRLGILTKPSAFNQAACGLVANTSKCSTEFLYLQLLNDRYLLNLMASGTAQQNLNVSKIKSYLIKLPPKKVMDRFNEVVQPLFKKIRLNGTTIMTIQQTRDTLLPKLMSGQVRVKLD